MRRGEVWIWLRRYLGTSFIFIVCIGFLCRAFANIPLPVDTSVSAVPDTSPVVILDAGHGGEDCGAIGLNGVYEKDINLSISSILSSQLRAAGIHVIETRTTDKLLYDPNTVTYGHRKSTDLANRAAIANQYENAVFVSIHMNSFPGESSNGMQVWYGNGDEEGHRLAKLLQETVKRDLQPQNHRKVKPSNGNMFLLDNVTCPSVLVECGFLTNRAECEKLSEEGYQKELSFVLFCAIINYLNMEETGKT